MSMVPENYLDTLRGTDIASKDDLSKMYDVSRADVGKALLAAKPIGEPVMVPAFGATAAARYCVGRSAIFPGYPVITASV